MGASEVQAAPPFDPNEEQAIAAFQHAAEELRFFKSQQWSVTNYALLAYAALASAPEGMGPWKVGANLLCALAVVLTAGVAAWVLRSLEKILTIHRNRIREARSKLPLDQAISDKSPADRTPTYTFGVLCAAVVLGMLVAITINLSRIPRVVACLSAGVV